MTRSRQGICAVLRAVIWYSDVIANIKNGMMGVWGKCESLI